jgi:hypothetical protein
VTALPPPIGAHRLLGGGRSTALVRPDGEVDWWCAPEPDSPPVLWSLLDPDGPAARWSGARPASMAPVPAGPTATTGLRIDRRAVEVHDGLVRQDGATALVRLVRADTPVEVVHEVGRRAFPGAATEVQVVGGETVVDGEVLRTRLLASTTWTGLAVVVGDAGQLDLDDLVGLIDELEAGRDRSRQLLPKWHPERVSDAIAVFDACTHPTGAILASATTSLPEVVGGDRQFDYRYTWLRDASLAASVAAQVGDRREADRHLAFLRELDDVLAAPLFDARGEPVPDERDVEGVAGWGGSQPVRVGNGAKDQVQFDALGFVVEAMLVCARVLGDETSWPAVRRIADRAADGDGPSSGIWELREPVDLLSADIGRWLALECAVRLSRRRPPWTAPRRWRRARRAVRQRVLGAIRADGSLPQRHDRPDGGGDASALLLVVCRLIRPRSARARRLVDVTFEELGAGPFLYRYEPDGRDGFDPGEGAFVPASWWAVSALAITGRVAEAQDRADQLCATLPPLLPEEWSVDGGYALGNIPLVWSHAECARALNLLDEARIRRRTGPLGLAVWRAVRRRQARRG